MLAKKTEGAATEMAGNPGKTSMIEVTKARRKISKRRCGKHRNISKTDQRMK